MGHSSPVHSCPSLLSPVSFYPPSPALSLSLASSLLFPLQTQSLFTHPCSLPVPPKGHLTSDQRSTLSLHAPAKADDFTNLDICLGNSLTLSILILLQGSPYSAILQCSSLLTEKNIVLKTSGKKIIRQKSPPPPFICNPLLPNAKLAFY